MSLKTYADTVNRSGDGDIAFHGVFYSPFRPEQCAAVPAFDLHHKMSKNDLAMSRMSLVIELVSVAKSFGVDEPVFGVKDGKVQIRSFDLSATAGPFCARSGRGKRRNIALKAGFRA